MSFTYLKIHRINEPLSYMDNRNKELEAKIESIEIEVTKHQTRIVYNCIDENENDIQVCGETFRKL